MFVDIRKLTRQQVKEVLEAAGWAWDDAKSIDGEQNRRDCEALVNEAYKREPWPDKDEDTTTRKDIIKRSITKG